MHFPVMVKGNKKNRDYSMENVCVYFYSQVEFSDTTQRVNKKSYKAFSMVSFVYFIDTEIVEKPIFFQSYARVWGTHSTTMYACKTRITKTLVSLSKSTI